jgi:signal transduction histidine kinase
MNKKASNLWLLFAVNIFISLIIAFGFVFLITLLLYNFGLLDFFMNNTINPRPLIPILSLLLLSTLLGMVLTFRVGRKILVPISQISEATKQVASGDFNVKVPNDSKIVAIKEMADNFNIMLQELSSIELLRNDFLVNVSHEFRTPLSSIEGFAQLLQDPSLTPEERLDYTKLIIESSKQLSTLTQNILKLSKLENQEIIFDKTEFRLDEQIREAVLLLEKQWLSKNINMIIELDNITFWGSESLLLQVWINLLENAIRFSNEDGNISIHLTTQDDSIIVTIKDDGKGMNQNEVKHIFDKFYQSDNAKKSGNGLGLSIVKRIIDLSKGTIEITSYPGTGSVFTIKLPISK